jgi:hypothetical protein
MMITVPRHFVTLSDDGRDRVRVSFRDPTAGKKGCLYIVVGQDAQDSPDTRTGAVFSLSVLFMINPAVLIRPNILAALEIKA